MNPEKPSEPQRHHDHCGNVQARSGDNYAGATPPRGISEPIILPQGDGTDVAFPEGWTDEQIRAWRTAYRVCPVEAK
jgi:hypothetical protein